MNANTFFNETADALLSASFITMVLFAVWHSRTTWRKTAMGIHNMTTSIMFALLLGLSGVQRVLGIVLTEDAPWVRTLVYVVVFAWTVYRLVLFARIRRRSRLTVPQRRLSD
jgi:tellurite resistance protein TehA-like permease